MLDTTMLYHLCNKDHYSKAEIELEISQRYKHLEKMYKVLETGDVTILYPKTDSQRPRPKIFNLESYIKNEIDKNRSVINDLKYIFREKLSEEETA